MSKIIFLAEEEIYDGDFIQIGKNQVRLTFNEKIPALEVLLSGFNLVNEHNGIIQTPREDYTYLYRTYDDPKIVELCNDNIPWVAPPVPPAPEPRIPTLEEVQEAKVTEMNEAQQLTIENGVTVTLTDGSEEKFSLTYKNQISLFGLKDEMDDGEDKLPWHMDDEDRHCSYYSPENMAIITKAAKRFVIFHITYFRDLRIYIRSLKTKEEVEAIEYGITIPVEYQSEPLRDMLAGVNIS